MIPCLHQLLPVRPSDRKTVTISGTNGSRRLSDGSRRGGPRPRTCLSWILLVAFLVFGNEAAWAEEQAPSANPPETKSESTNTGGASNVVSVNADAFSANDVAAARQKAIAYLATAQANDGSWTSSEAPGISGLVVYGLLRAGASPDHPAVAKGLQHLLSFRQADGGLYFPKSHHGNYETAITLMALRAANTNGQYDDVIAGAGKYVRQVQWDESESIDASDPKYGGAGYGRSGDRPDLSNTTFFLEALQATGAAADDPAVQRALVFLSRCQNLESEHNVTPFAAKVNDGGFYYTPAAGGSSQAGPTENGGLRSYGSMTYAGLKSMIFAGVAADDPRVTAAVSWIQRHYTLEENPGMGQQGVFYYYQMFAKALDAIGKDELIDDAGVAHPWRAELTQHLLQLQQDNGSWVNTNPRWYEGDPNLATAYALLALAYSAPLDVDR
jgi:squalene-hopene/tetraprenyl-beta-curcumene cyclase